MRPIAMVRIDELTLQRGETVTVWLNKETADKRDCVQVELRVCHDGTPEVFTNGVDSASFEEWRPIKGVVR